MPRVRNHLAATFNLDEQGRIAWVRHWLAAGLDAYENHLSRDKATGTYCHGDRVTNGGPLPRSATPPAIASQGARSTSIQRCGALSNAAWRTSASPARSRCASREHRPHIDSAIGWNSRRSWNCHVSIEHSGRLSISPKAALMLAAAHQFAQSGGTDLVRCR